MTLHPPLGWGASAVRPEGGARRFMSRHPTPPLPFHLFSSPPPAQTRFPRPRPRPCPATIWQFRATGAPTAAPAGRVSAGRGQSPPCFHLGAPTPTATRLGGRGQPWLEKRGGWAGCETPETMGLRGGSLTFKVTRRGGTTGPHQNSGHRSSENPVGCTTPQGSPEATTSPTLPCIKRTPFHWALAPTQRELGPILLESPARVCGGRLVG